MNDSTSPSPPPEDQAKTLLPDDWQKLSALVDRVLDAPAARRAEVLDEVSAGDAQQRIELERLVAECERDVPLFNRPAAERFARLLDHEDEIQPPETLGGRYRIERELGRGGMACVYLAQDAKHARQVAVKVIRADIAASLGRERFLREIGIATRLRHPNIVPLYDSGDADGVLYFVMPYEEGESLRIRLHRDGALPASECASILRDVARALAYAHEHGVVHRDVKPDNVMLSGGAAVVTDFGIAKAIAAAAGGDRPERDGARDLPTTAITQVGTGLGTPAYMAPEQAVGDPSTDHRADIYSFGCLAYELFAGKPPFHDLPTHELIAAHVGTKPVPLSEVSTAASESVSRLVARCLEKDPAARPQSAQELITELEGNHTGPNEMVRRHRPSSRAVLVASVIAGVGLIGIAGYVASRIRASSGPAAPREVTVAVLPLLSAGDSVQRELAYGLSDEIATALVKVRGVRVMSRRSIAASREQRNVDTEKTGRELGAQFLVMGSLREVGGRLTVLANLVQARDGAVVWADQFERDPDELATVRDEIARSVGDSLRVKAGAAVDARAHGRATRVTNPEAYRLYVLGRRAFTRRALFTPATADLFRQATALDTLYAEAYSGLSYALAITPFFQNVRPNEVFAEAKTAAQRALRLDPTLAEPHIVLGMLHQYTYEWDRAGAEFETAVRLRSADDIEPLVAYGRFLLYVRGRSGDALTVFRTARGTEPASAVVSSWLSYTYYLQGQLDSALVESARSFQNDSTNMTTLSLGAVVRAGAGDSAGARDFSSRLRRLRRVESERPRRWGAETSRAFTMLGMGDTTGAMAAFERATDANEMWPWATPIIDPIFDPMRTSARFHALLQRVNLRVSEVAVVHRGKSR